MMKLDDRDSWSSCIKNFSVCAISEAMKHLVAVWSNASNPGKSFNIVCSSLYLTAHLQNFAFPRE